MSRATKAIVLSSGQGVTALVGLIGAGVLARVFSSADYASYRQVHLACSFAFPFVTLGFDKALYYFVPRQPERARGVLSENLLWFAGAGAALGLFLVVGGNTLLARRFNNPSLASLLVMLAPYPVLILPSQALAGCLMATNRTEQVPVFNVISRLLILAAVLVPAVVTRAPAHAVIGLSVGAALSTAYAVTLMARACTRGPWRPTPSGMKEQILFSVPLGVATIVATLSQTIDQVLVAASTTPEVFALYTNGAMELPLVTVVAGSIASVLLVDYARMFKHGELGEARALMHRAMQMCAMALFPAMVLLCAVAPEFMSSVYGSDYRSSATPFRLYLLMLPARTINSGAVLIASNRGREILYSTVIALAANVLLLAIAIRELGPMLAPVGSLVGMYLVLVPYLARVLRSTLRCSTAELFPWFGLARVLLASCVGLLPVCVVRGAMSSHSDAVVLMVATASYAVTTLLVFARLGWLRVTRLRDWVKPIVDRRH